MLDVSKDIWKMPVQSLSCFYHGFESTVSRPKIPSLEEFLGILWITVAPKPPQGLLDCPGSACLQVHLPDVGKFFLPPLRDIILVHKPKMLAALTNTSINIWTYLCHGVRAIRMPKK